MIPLRSLSMLAIIAASTLSPRSTRTTTMSATHSVSLQSITPILIVDSVEPGIAFWRDRLGFKLENEVPGPNGKLMFASVKKDGVEIMYQTRASVLADDPSKAAELTGHSTALFIEVTSMGDLDVIEREVAGAPVVKGRHKTPYGTTEIYIREPGGNIVGFAAR